jgi:hypothetical protein
MLPAIPVNRHLLVQLLRLVVVEEPVKALLTARPRQAVGQAVVMDIGAAQEDLVFQDKEILEERQEAGSVPVAAEPAKRVKTVPRALQDLMVAEETD